jgi:hypothetical protein
MDKPLKLAIVREQPHSQLEIFIDHLEVHPCDIDGRPYGKNADSFFVHLYTSDSTWIRRFVTEFEVQIRDIQSHLHEPPDDAAEIAFPITKIMAQTAVRFALLEGEASASGKEWLDANAAAFRAYNKHIEEHGFFYERTARTDPQAGTRWPFHSVEGLYGIGMGHPRVTDDRGVVICECRDKATADRIAQALNAQHRTEEAKR